MKIPTLSRTIDDNGWSYRSVEVALDGRIANITMKGPESPPERSVDTWSLRAFRELEDALLRLRINHLEVGLINLRTEGDAAKVLEHEAFIIDGAESDWFLGEIMYFQHQCLRRLDNMAKSTFALIEMGHCFVGVLFELALSADRIYMFLDDDGENTIELSQANSGIFQMASGSSRLEARFPGEPDAPANALDVGGPLDAETAEEMGLVTVALDDIDWDDEVRIAMEERISLSPDALTGMEQNLRFGGTETAETKIYGRLSAWQNWIFQRPNAVGDRGALTLYGHPERPVFDFRRT
jgi:benzoyl-CoA-dihydrodiol lyase